MFQKRFFFLTIYCFLLKKIYFYSRFENIELAPDHLVVAGYPGLGGGNGGRKGGAGGGDGGGKRKSQPPASSSSASTTSGGGGYCPGGSLQDCIRFCPSDDDGQEFSSCVTDCGNQCPT